MSGMLSLVLVLAMTTFVMTSPRSRRSVDGSTLPPELADKIHGVVMGVSHPDCDDAQVN